MKKMLVTLAACLTLMAFCSGCASVYPMGALYTEVTLPIAATLTVEGQATGAPSHGIDGGVLFLRSCQLG